MTRRDLLVLLGAVPFADGRRLAALPSRVLQEPTPALAPGAPSSAERLALIAAFRAQSGAVAEQFEAHTHRGEWSMPYRLLRPRARGALPLVVFLHGSGGLGSDNEKQLGLGNIFGTRLWALPEIQRRFPCVVLVPQTDRGWVRYGPPAEGDSVARPIPGLGDGARAALELVDRLARDLPIDRRRIYLAGQSMGGAGVWHLLAERPSFFAAAIACCGSASTDRGAGGARTPLWNFHGDADQTVPVAISRDRIAQRRSAGGHPIHTEYAGVGHNAWEWAFTEPALPPWLFAHRLG